MKTKFNLFFVMLLSSLCITFTSCSDDDDDDKTVDYSKEIAGTYKGDIFMTGVDVPIASDATIIVTQSGNSKVKLAMDQEILTLPIKIECESDVKLVSDAYTIKGNTSVTLPVKGAGNMDAPVELDGSFNKEKKATINITVKIPNSPITVVYKGSLLNK